MPLTLWIAIVAVVASPFVLWWALAGERLKPVFAMPGFGGAEGVGVEADTLLEAFRRVTGGKAEPVNLDTQLARAGLIGKVDGRQLATARAVCIVAGALGALVILATGVSMLKLLGAALVVFVGAVLPKVWLNRRIEQRQREIGNGLPDALDQLTILSRAGLGLQPAISRTSRALRGPLAEELGRTIQDLEIGLSREDAFGGFVERTGSPDVKRLVVALDQAAAVGAPIAAVLDAQAEHLRSLRELRAEEKAQKLPVKLALPLVLCILPTLFLVILGPAMLRISESFG